MKKVAIITDSIACLTRELITQYGIGIIPVNFYSGGKVYRDGIDVSPAEAYELFKKDPQSYKSSAPSPEECINAYREASKQAENILCITMSSKLSTLYNVALGAREKVRSELLNTQIEVLDSYTASAGEGFVALAAARASEMGKNLSEVIKVAKEVKDKVNFIVLLDTIRYVYRSGRVPKVAAHAASLLNIRPILVVSSGVVRFVSAARSRSHGIDRILNMMRNRVGNSNVRVAVTHAYAIEAAEKLKERVASEFNCVELRITEFSPLMGYACGTGALGLAFYTEPTPPAPQ